MCNVRKKSQYFYTFYQTYIPIYTSYFVFSSVYFIDVLKLNSYLSIVTANRFIIEATADKTREYSATLQAPPSMSKSRAK